MNFHAYMRHSGTLWCFFSGQYAKACWSFRSTRSYLSYGNTVPWHNAPSIKGMAFLPLRVGSDIFFSYFYWHRVILQVEKEIGEKRIISYHGAGISLAPEISFSDTTASCENPEKVRRIWSFRLQLPQIFTFIILSLTLHSFFLISHLLSFWYPWIKKYDCLRMLRSLTLHIKHY